jgi:hypothetical protein
VRASLHHEIETGTAQPLATISRHAARG